MTYGTTSLSTFAGPVIYKKNELVMKINKLRNFINFLIFLKLVLTGSKVFAFLSTPGAGVIKK